MENDPLAAYLDALARDVCYRVDEVLKTAPHETTEVVYFVGANAAELGPFVRKRIAVDAAMGDAYGHLFQAQRDGRRFRHLPRIYDVHTTGNELVVVMEYIQGRTLRDEVYERDGSVALAAQWFPLLCDGVMELHEQFSPPLIHRDLKPTNIVVSDAGLTIIDFGIARAFREGAAGDTAHFGTRCYAPPEQFGYGQTDERSDVYALGMLGAMGYEAGRALLEKCAPRLKTALQWASAAGLALCVWIVLQILQAQCTLGLQSTASLRLGQLKHRLPLALVLLGCILTSAFLPRPLEWLLGNRLMRWLSGLTFNFYIWHQFLAVQYVRKWFPNTLHSDPGLQWAFTVLCYASTLVLAAALTAVTDGFARWGKSFCSKRTRKQSAL